MCAFGKIWNRVFSKSVLLEAVLLAENRKELVQRLSRFCVKADGILRPIDADVVGHGPTSVGSSLAVSCDVAGNPITKFLGINVGQLLHHALVVIEVFGELLAVLLNERNGADFDETRSDVAHANHSCARVTSIGKSGSS